LINQFGSTALFDVSYGTSSVSEDWVSLVTSPDFDAMYQQTRSYKSAPSRGMVSGVNRSGDAPVADRRPPRPTRSAATRV